jgi:hypothetical protein
MSPTTKVENLPFRTSAGRITALKIGLKSTAVFELAIDKPAYGQLRASNELKKKGIFVSPGGVRSIWLRHDLETFKKWLKALEAKAAQGNLILTEKQVRALENAKDEKES